MEFDTDFESLTGHPPFPWQRRLFDEWFARGRLPSAVDIPTGLGKTAVMAVWLLARARQANLPRRLAYVVDRRAVVDQATEYAERLRCALKAARLEHVPRGLRLRGRPLPISTLRGQFTDNREWMDDPAAPAIIVGTVDMIGSRLLFEGYGLSRRMRPYAAGLLGCDTLALLDEAHLSRPFERMLGAVETNRAVEGDNGVVPANVGPFAGPAATSTVPPPFRVLPLSATPGVDSTSDQQRIRIGDDDWAHETVRARLDAVKTLSVENLEKEAKLDEALAERAIRLMREKTDETGKPVRIVIYCDRRGDAEKTADILRKSAKREALDAETILFVGGRRAHEREQAARQLKKVGLIPGHDAPESVSVFLVATSAGEVGVDLDADHMIGDLVAWDRMAQRLGRVNRRGLGKARVLVIDQGPPDGRRAREEDVECHRAARKLLDQLPRDEAGGRQAGPAALTRLGDDPELRQLVKKASSPTPLYPALSRPVVESWAMTSLADHAGRPEVGPWLRGWDKSLFHNMSLFFRPYQAS